MDLAGLFSFEMEQNGSSFWFSETYRTSGYWMEKVDDHNIPRFTFVSNEKGSYFTFYSVSPSTFISRMVGIRGQIKLYVWKLGYHSDVCVRENPFSSAVVRGITHLWGCLVLFIRQIPSLWLLITLINVD